MYIYVCTLLRMGSRAAAGSLEYAAKEVRKSSMQISQGKSTVGRRTAKRPES